MTERTFGAAGVSIPVVGQGTWQMEMDDADSCVAALRRGLDLGLTHLDTAELYGNGEVEERVVSQAIAGRRSEIFLVSKVLPSNASRKGTIEACHRSLKRLRTDHLDCYLLHWPGPYPLEETIAAFEELVDAGTIRSWGVSNFDVDLLAEAHRIAPGRMACNQVLYHLEERRIEHEVIPWCKDHGVALVAYSPFGAGRFVTPGTIGQEALAEVAKSHDATPRQTALAFLARHDHAFVIPKASRSVHVEDNAGAQGLRLTAEGIARLSEAFPAAVGGGLPTL